MNSLFVRAAVSIGIGSMAFACAEKKSDSNASSQSVAFTPGKWPTPSVVVCWMTPQGMHADQIAETTKDVIKRAVTREFNGRTGISFVGWKSCDATTKPDLRVTDFGTNSSPGTRGSAGGIGALDMEQINGNGPSAAQRSPMQLNTVSGCMRTYQMGGNSLNACITFTALHEFGHVAGLRHEHAHPKSTCQNKEDLVQPGMSAQDHQYSTDYDPRSIMNYCFRDEVYETKLPADQIRLSDKDVAGLNLLYPPGGAAAPSARGPSTNTPPSTTGVGEESTIAPNSAPDASQPSQDAPPADGASNPL